MDKKNRPVRCIRILRILWGSRKDVRKKGYDERVLCGPESKALEMCSKLDKKKFETTIVYSKEGRLLKEFEDIGVRVEKFDTKNKFNLQEALYIYHLIKANKISILQTHGLRFDFFGFIAARLAGVPHIITRHVAISHHLISEFRKKMYIFFDNFAIKSAAKVVTVSKAVEDDLVATQGIDRSKILTIVNGVDLRRFSEVNMYAKTKIRMEFGIDEKTQVVGMIAQLSYWKGIPYFLRAIPLILSKCSNVMFLMIGDGPERKKLETMVEELGVSSYVIFAGFRRDISDIISAIDISVLSSLREGLPLAILESMAMGKPIVATDVGGVSELVLNGKTGFLVPPRDSCALANAIIELFEDKEKARQFGKVGRKHVEQNFNLSQMIKRYENLYTQIADKNFKSEDITAC